MKQLLPEDITCIVALDTREVRFNTTSYGADCLDKLAIHLGVNQENMIQTIIGEALAPDTMLPSGEVLRLSAAQLQDNVDEEWCLDAAALIQKTAIRMYNEVPIH